MLWYQQIRLLWVSFWSEERENCCLFSPGKVSGFKVRMRACDWRSKCSSLGSWLRQCHLKATWALLYLWSYECVWQRHGRNHHSVLCSLCAFAWRSAAPKLPDSQAECLTLAQTKESSLAHVYLSWLCTWTPAWIAWVTYTFWICRQVDSLWATLCSCLWSRILSALTKVLATCLSMQLVIVETLDLFLPAKSHHCTLSSACTAWRTVKSYQAWALPQCHCSSDSRSRS